MQRSKFVLLAGIAVLLAACELPQQDRAQVKLPESGSAGAEMVKQYCSNCHVPPLPSVHTADQWASVVYRMQDRRRSKALPRMSDEERETLVAYLEKHAKG